MSNAAPIRPNGNNHDISRGRVTTDEEVQTTTERPEGIPNVRTERAWDDKLDGDHESARNLKRQAQDTPAALETHESRRDAQPQVDARLDQPPEGRDGQGHRRERAGEQPQRPRPALAGEALSDYA